MHSQLASEQRRTRKARGAEEDHPTEAWRRSLWLSVWLLVLFGITVSDYDNKGRPHITLHHVDDDPGTAAGQEGRFFYTATRYDAHSRVTNQDYFWRPHGDEAPVTGSSTWHTYGFVNSYDADIRHVQEQLGHACLQTTQVYTHVSMKRLKEVHAATHPGAKLSPRPGREKEA